MPDGPYYFRQSIAFQECYKCNSQSDLASISVSGETSSIGSVIPPVAAFELFAHRSKHSIPICRDCIYSIWYLRIIHLAFFTLFCLSPWIWPLMISEDAVIYANIITLGFGPILTIISYGMIRDWFFDIHIRADRGGFLYYVSKRYRRQFADSVAQQQEMTKQPKNANNNALNAKRRSNA